MQTGRHDTDTAAGAAADILRTGNHGANTAGTGRDILTASVQSTDAAAAAANLLDNIPSGRNGTGGAALDNLRAAGGLSPYDAAAAVDNLGTA